MDWAVITGASSGIGRSLAVEMCRRGVKVLGIGRRAAALEKTSALVTGAGLSGFKPVTADLATEAGRRTIVAALPEGAKVGFLVQLAAAMPIQKLETITPESWRAAFATNAEGRMFLTLALLDRFAPGARLLFLKSGMSLNPRIGCIQPAASLAASLMMERVLKLELKPRGILVSATKPGYVLTETMQATLDIPADILPEVKAFLASPMMKPELSARYLAWMLTSTSDEDYVRDDWDIADTKHHRHWLGDQPLYAT